MIQLVARRLAIESASLRRCDGEGSPEQCRALGIWLTPNKRFCTIIKSNVSVITSEAFLVVIPQVIIDAMVEDCYYPEVAFIFANNIYQEKAEKNPK